MEEWWRKNRNNRRQEAAVLDSSLVDTLTEANRLAPDVSVQCHLCRNYFSTPNMLALMANSVGIVSLLLKATNSFGHSWCKYSDWMVAGINSFWILCRLRTSVSEYCAAWEHLLHFWMLALVPEHFLHFLDACTSAAEHFLGLALVLDIFCTLGGAGTFLCTLGGLHKCWNIFMHLLDVAKL